MNLAEYKLSESCS